MKNKFSKVFYKIKINEFFYCNNLLVYYLIPIILLFDLNKKILFNIFYFYQFNFSFIKNSYVLNYFKKKYNSSKLKLQLFSNLKLYSFFFNLELKHFRAFIKNLYKLFELPFSIFFIFYENSLIYFDKNKILLNNGISLLFLIFFINFFLYKQISIAIKYWNYMKLSFYGNCDEDDFYYDYQAI